MARICIVTPGQLGSNPRVVKEADALAEAGHDVTVICTKVADFVEPRDQSVMARCRFKVHRIAFDNRLAWRLARLPQMAARLLWQTGIAPLLADRASSAMTIRLANAACTVPADLYIAHYVPALPAAARAAAKNGGRYAFDAEDFHPGDWPDSPAFKHETRLIKAVERRYLPGACYVTAAAPLIAEAYAQTYSIPLPVVLLNVFPRSSVPPAQPPRVNSSPSPSLYWFSQTVGPGRGLETAVEAIAHAQSRPHFVMRGTLGAGYRAELEALAANLGVADRIHFLPPINPDELELAGTAFDLGYAGELAETQNHRIALANKLFSHLIGGVPVLASDIPSHRQIAPEMGDAMQLFPLGDAGALAAAIDHWLLSPERLAKTRAHAWTLGQERFNWDVEKAKLTALVERTLARKAD